MYHFEDLNVLCIFFNLVTKDSCCTTASTKWKTILNIIFLGSRWTCSTGQYFSLTESTNRKKKTPKFIILKIQLYYVPWMLLFSFIQLIVCLFFNSFKLYFNINLQKKHRKKQTNKQKIHTYDIRNNKCNCGDDQKAKKPKGLIPKATRNLTVIHPGA